MPEPTVWAVTDPQGRVVALSHESAANVIGRMNDRGMTDEDFDAYISLADQVRRNMTLDRYEHAGYRVAPMALVTPQALAVVEAAVYTCDFYRQLLGASGHPMYLDELFGKVAAYRAATARDAKGELHEQR